jgi:large subunit ribosomal protein L9
MELILLEQVAQLGEPGDLVNVKSGYGRNFLIPSGKAVRADETNKAEYEERKSALLSAEADRKEAALKLATQLEEIQIKLAVAVSEEGTLYGSIGTREISEAIIEQGVNIEKSSVRLSEGALKEVGDYQVDIELHPEVVQSVSVTIEAITEE